MENLQLSTVEQVNRSRQITMLLDSTILIHEFLIGARETLNGISPKQYGPDTVREARYYATGNNQGISPAIIALRTGRAQVL